MSVEYIKTLQKRIYNQRLELERLNTFVSKVEIECEKWKNTLEEFKNDIKRLIWFDIELSHEETQYLTHRIEELYGELSNEK